MNTRYTAAILVSLLAALMAAFGSTTPARAQDGGASPSVAASSPAGDLDTTSLGESAKAVQDLRGIKDKTLIFVFDVSGSMKGELMRRAREATINIIRDGTNVGDRVVLYTFGSGYTKVFDQRLATESDRSALIEQVPSQPGDGAGTNIRRPHHEALKILESQLPHPGAVVLLTDSFNDEPKRDTPEWTDYIRYYTPGGRLTKYPDTPENRDYERLLNKLYRSQKVNMYGIGVQIDQSGRPVERLPQAAPSVEAVPNLTGGTQRTLGGGDASTKPVDSGLPLPLLIGGGLAAAAIIGGVLFFVASSKPSPLRIAGGPIGPKEYSLKSGQTIKLGGEGVTTFDAYPLPGSGVAALLKGGSSGRFTIAPSPTQTPGLPVPKVFHNGLALEKESPLTYGDEVRVAVPDPSGVGVAREFRLKFEDPTQKF